MQLIWLLQDLPASCVYFDPKINPGILASALVIVIPMSYWMNLQGMQKYKLKDKETMFQPGVIHKAITVKEGELNWHQYLIIHHDFP